jgi:hypothetical protein
VCVCEWEKKTYIHFWKGRRGERVGERGAKIVGILGVF